jgi:hypothetical protein
MDSVAAFLVESGAGFGDAGVPALSEVMISGRAREEGGVTYSIGESFLAGLRESD